MPISSSLSAVVPAPSRPSAGAVPGTGHGTIVHIDSNPMAISASYETAYPDFGRCQASRWQPSTEALSDDLGQTAGLRRSPGQVAQLPKRKKFAIFDELAAGPMKDPIRPERLVADLNAVLPDDAVVVCDPGTPCPYFSAYYRCDSAGPLLSYRIAPMARLGLFDPSGNGRANRPTEFQSGCRGHG